MNALLAIFACVFVAELTATSGAKSLSSSRRISCTPIVLQNGRVRYRPKSGFVQFICNKSYLLAGEKYMKCVHGKWEGAIPTCVRNTCKSISVPKNGYVYPSHRGGVLNFFCSARHELHGPQVVYCDGKKWNNYLPTCIESTRNVSLTCDFEHEDLCGWSHDINHDFDWIRLKNSTPSWHVGTGPSYDHTHGTSGEGYYMYIESTSKKQNDTARLISPVYKKQENNTCLEFFYHMHGITMGELRVYLKKVKDSWDLSPSDAIFTMSGNQGLEWKRSFSELGSINDDFQIIMEGVRGSSYLSDIAIDDVRIIENCAEEVEESTLISSTTNDVTEDEFIYESCSSRCGIKHGNHSLCDCDDTCFTYGSCCADYISVCLLNDFTLGDFTEENFTTESEETDAITEAETTPPEDELVLTTPQVTILMVNKIKPIPTTTTQKPAITLSKKPVVTTSKKPLATTTKKPTPTTKNPTPTTEKPTPTTKKPTPTTRKTTTKKNMTSTTKSPIIVTTKKSSSPPDDNNINNFNHIFNRTKKIRFFPTVVVQNVTKLPIRRPNYKRNYANKNSFKDKENDYYKHDMLTVAPNIDDEEFTELMPTEIPKKLASLLQVEHTNVKETKVESSGIPTFIFVSVGLLCMGILVTVYVVKRGMACTRIRRIRNGSFGDSASDVRYLTSDEMLDFTLATPN